MRPPIVRVLPFSNPVPATVRVPCVMEARDTSPNTVLVKTAVLPVPDAMVKLVSVPENEPSALKLAPVKLPSKAARRLAALVKAVAVNVLPARVNVSPAAKCPKVTVCVSATPVTPLANTTGVPVAVSVTAGAVVAPTEVDVNVKPAVPAAPPIVKPVNPPVKLPFVMPVV